MRPAADVVVPFHGTAAALRALLERLAVLQLAPGDTITVADNTPDGVGSLVAPGHAIRTLAVPERQSSYFARNRGAAAGEAPWLVFIDADVVAPADLLDRYLSSAPPAGVAVLAGAVRDVTDSGGGRETLIARYARLRRLLDQSNTLDSRWPYAQTANCAVRREAFDDVGGFVDDIRSGGDADLCFRLAERGWKLERRADAIVEHRSRTRLTGFLGQRARHGSGAEWLAGRYPGFVDGRASRLALVRGVASGALRSCVLVVRGDRDEALLRLCDPVAKAAFEVGRLQPNSVLDDRSALGTLRASVLR